MKNYLKNIIIKALKWLDPSYSEIETISNDNEKKFTHIIPTLFESDFASSSIVFRTVPYPVWQVKTKNHELIAADKHIVIDDQGEQVWMCDLNPGMCIQTSSGLEEVKEVHNLNINAHMYDLQIDSDDHLYYADGILSHNTTVTGGYLLWHAMFVPDSTILVVANNNAAALEIMGRIRFAYEECPNHIRAGMVTYNKHELVFDNGSRIVSRATTGQAARGLSVTLLYCVGGENTVTVKHKQTGEITDKTIEDLYIELDNQ